MTKTSRVVGAGAGFTGLVAASSARRGPSDKWSGVTAADIGSDYAVVVPAAVKKRKEAIERLLDENEEFAFKNKFIKGSSKFIWFNVRVKPVKKLKPKVKKPLNYNTKLDKRTKAEFTKTLNANITAASNLMMKELLPQTLALHSAMAQVKELVAQLTDDKVSLPVDYMQKKMTEATFLRIIRFVSEQFKLTEKERKLMVSEYTRPWSSS